MDIHQDRIEVDRLRNHLTLFELVSIKETSVHSLLDSDHTLEIASIPFQSCDVDNAWAYRSTHAIERALVLVSPPILVLAITLD